jgi:hypothetical protein
MRYYVLIDNTCGNVESKFNWGDDRDLPANYPLGANQQIITLLDAEGENLDALNSCYNPNSKTFGPKLAISSNVTQFDHVSGSATITITYPVNTVNESCNLSIDGQSVPVNIVGGVGTFTFTSQVTGWHMLTASSSSFYGQNTVSVEAV